MLDGSQRELRKRLKSFQYAFEGVVVCIAYAEEYMDTCRFQPGSCCSWIMAAIVSNRVGTHYSYNNNRLDGGVCQYSSRSDC